MELYNKVEFTYKKRIEKLLTNIKQNKIKIKKMRKKDDFYSFLIKNKDLKPFKRICTEMNIFEVKIIKVGVNNLLSSMILHIGLIITLIVGVCCGIYFSGFVYRYEFTGLDRIKENDIINILSNNGIALGKNKSNYDMATIEKIIETDINHISLASAAIVGTTLKINIKEKLYNKEIDKSLHNDSLIANYDGKVEEIVVVQGTALVKSGDYVKSGDVLIAPYMISSNGEKTPIRAMGKISGVIWHYGKEVFDEKSVAYVKSGNNIISKSVIMGNNIIINTKEINTFANYEVDVKEKYLFNNLLLPIKLVIMKYNELVLQSGQNFEFEKENLLKKSEHIAFEQLKDDQEFVSKNQHIYKIGTKYIIATTIEARGILGEK